VCIAYIEDDDGDYLEIRFLEQGMEQHNNVTNV
jgi:hypothetical protein